jgi:hypothetical protein
VQRTESAPARNLFVTEWTLCAHNDALAHGEKMIPMMFDALCIAWWSVIHPYLIVDLAYEKST